MHKYYVMINYEKLKSLCPFGDVEKNAALKHLSTMRLGGEARFLVCPKNEKELKNLIDYLRQSRTKFFVLGNGSNVLMCDGKYRGVLIKLTHLNKISVHKNLIHAEAGATLANVIRVSRAQSLAGLEEGVGIPACIGGAVKMNASAYGFEIAKVLQGVQVLRKGEIIYLSSEECKFSYRNSGFQKDDIILSADFKLKKGKKKEIESRLLDTINKRKNLPLLPSLGSVFKREEGVIVSRLLDEMGFKGQSVGGAMVSREHAGIIVNIGNATCKDVKKLIKIIKKRCFREKNLVLHEEIKFL